MTSTSSPILKNLSRYILWHPNALCRLENARIRDDKLSAQSRIELIINPVNLKIKKLCRPNEWVGRINRGITSGVSAFKRHSRIWQKQDAAIWRKSPRRNISAPALWCNPNGVSYGVHGNANRLAESPTRLKPAAARTCNLLLDIGEAPSLAIARNRRILNTLWLAKTMLLEKIRKQLATLFKRPIFKLHLSDCFPFGGHKNDGVTRTPNVES
jgi:hypothetical protein